MKNAKTIIVSGIIGLAVLGSAFAVSAEKEDSKKKKLEERRRQWEDAFVKRCEKNMVQEECKYRVPLIKARREKEKKEKELEK